MAPRQHPGEVLLEEFMIPAGLSVARLARELSCPTAELDRLLRAGGHLSAELALRLAQRFGVSERYWLALQERYDTAGPSTSAPRRSLTLRPS